MCRAGQLDNTIVVFTTDNGAEAISFPDGGVTSFKGQKGESWEGGYRAPCAVRWPGHIKPGTVTKQMFAALDWVPTPVDIAGGPKGDGLKKRIEKGKYPGIVKTTLEGFYQRDFLEGKTPKSARDGFYFFSGPTPSAVRFKNWKMYQNKSTRRARYDLLLSAVTFAAVLAIFSRWRVRLLALVPCLPLAGANWTGYALSQLSLSGAAITARCIRNKRLDQSGSSVGSNSAVPRRDRHRA